MAEDYYSRLGLDRGMSTAEISGELDRLSSVWGARKVTQPRKAIPMLDMIDAARRAFADDEARAAYDTELAGGDRPTDEQLQYGQWQEWEAKARRFYSDRQWDLAATAVAKAVPLVNGLVDKPAFYTFCARVYYSAGQDKKVIEYANMAIVDDMDCVNAYIIKAMSEHAVMGDPDRNKRDPVDDPEQTLDFAVAAAQRRGDRRAEGTAKGLKARYQWDRLSAKGGDAAMSVEPLAREAQQLGDAWGNADKVLLEIDAVKRRRKDEDERARRERERKRRQEEEERRRREQEEEERRRRQREEDERRRREQDAAAADAARTRRRHAIMIILAWVAIGVACFLLMRYTGSLFSD